MSGQWNQWNYTTGLAETPSTNCIMNMSMCLTPIAVTGIFFFPQLFQWVWDQISITGSQSHFVDTNPVINAEASIVNTLQAAK